VLNAYAKTAKVFIFCSGNGKIQRIDIDVNLKIASSLGINDEKQGSG
jgi:hypothetical protein